MWDFPHNKEAAPVSPTGRRLFSMENVMAIRRQADINTELDNRDLIIKITKRIVSTKTALTQLFTDINTVIANVHADDKAGFETKKASLKTALRTTIDAG